MKETVEWGLVNEVASEMGEHTPVELTEEEMDLIQQKNREELKKKCNGSECEL